MKARDLSQNTWTHCGPDGAPGDCHIGWTRFEGNEWYADTRTFCVRVKNWSHDLQRGYIVGAAWRDVTPDSVFAAAATGVTATASSSTAPPPAKVKPKTKKFTRKRMKKD